LCTKKDDSNLIRPLARVLLCVPFSALTLIVRWQEVHSSHKKPISLIYTGFPSNEMEEEDPRGKWLNQTHLENGHQTIGSISSYLLK